MILNLNTGERLVGEEYCEDTSVWFKRLHLYGLHDTKRTLIDILRGEDDDHWGHEELHRVNEEIQSLKIL